MQYLAFLTVDAAKLEYSSSTKKIERKDDTSEELISIMLQNPL